MAQQMIKFKPTNQESMPISIGRNGTLKTSGVAIKPLPGEVWVQAVTSKGQEARCVVALPPDPDVLREMAAVLLMTAEDLQAQEVQSAA